MSPELTGILGIILLLVLMFLRLDVGVSMACVGLLGFAVISGLNSAMAMVAFTPYTVIAYYPFAVIPLFVFMGELVSNSGMGSDLYNSAHKWLGQLPGGLAISSVAACGMFAAICGNSTAETLTIGKVALGQMKRFKYADDLSCGTIASGGTIGILIPPSITFVVYGILTEQSIGALFMAGILPGVLMCLVFASIIIGWARLKPAAAPAGPRTSFKEKIVSLKSTWMVISLFILVLGGIYLGVFTPTEAGAIGAAGAIILTLITRRLTRSNLLASVTEAGTTTASILLLMAGAYIFMRFITVSKLPFVLAQSIQEVGLPTFMIIIVIFLVYIILGMFMDIIACTVLTVPLILPVITSLGLDPIWFGVVVVIITEMGLITPPIGMNVFILTNITDTPMSTMFRGVWPFVAGMILVIALITIFPQITLFIPNMMR